MAVKLAGIAFDLDFFAWLAQSGSVTDGAHRVIRREWEQELGLKQGPKLEVWAVYY
jgi:hypothetical protein